MRSTAKLFSPWGISSYVESTPQGQTALYIRLVIVLDPSKARKLHQVIRPTHLSSSLQQVEEVYYHSEVPKQLYWLLLAVYLPLVTIGVVFNVGLLYVVLSTRSLCH